MRFSELATSTLQNFKVSNLLVPLFIGKPGGGKSALARYIRDQLGVLPEHCTEFNPSLRDPVDILGTPNNEGDYTEWKPPIEFYRLREDPNDHRPRLLILEEMTDATVMMQNPTCRIILDRMAGELKLHHNLFIIGTGNATEHNSGASRMTTKLGNRVQQFHYDENLDDWLRWAYDNGIHHEITSYLQWKPDHLSLFDPTKSINATPRSWEFVNAVSRDLPIDLYQSNVAALVGPGPAAEFIGFRAVNGKLPKFEDVIAAPDTHPIPPESEPSIRYAFAGMMASYTTKDNIGLVRRVMKRMPPEMAAMTLTMATKRDNSLREAREFVEWAMENQQNLA